MLHIKWCSCLCVACLFCTIENSPANAIRINWLVSRWCCQCKKKAMSTTLWIGMKTIWLFELFQQAFLGFGKCEFQNKWFCTFVVLLLHPNLVYLMCVCVSMCVLYYTLCNEEFRTWSVNYLVNIWYVVLGYWEEKPRKVKQFK